MLITLEGTVNSIAYFIKKVMRTILYPFFKPDTFLTYLKTDYSYFVEVKTMLLIASFLFYIQHKSESIWLSGKASKTTLAQILNTLRNINFFDALFTAGPYAFGVFLVFQVVAYFISLRKPEQRQVVFRIGAHYFSAFIIINFLMFLLFSIANLMDIGTTLTDYLFSFTLFLMPIVALVMINQSNLFNSELRFWKVLTLLITGIILYFVQYRPFISQDDFTNRLAEKDDSGDGNLKLLDLNFDDQLLHLNTYQVNDSSMILKLSLLLENQSDFLASIQKSDYLTFYNSERKDVINHFFHIESWEDAQSPVMLVQPGSLKWITFSSDTIRHLSAIPTDTLSCRIHFKFPRLRKANDKGVGFYYARTYKKQVTFRPVSY